MLHQSFLGGRSFSYRGVLNLPTGSSPYNPIIVALHGGTYTSEYFDVLGHSLLNRAEMLGIPAVAIDRPGYGQTSVMRDEDVTQEGNAAILNEALGELWQRERNTRPGIILLGHSIGGAIALRIAALRPKWPLLGICVSGVGLTIAPGVAAASQGLPPISYVDMPSSIKELQMFGSAGTYDSSAMQASHAADCPAPRQELIEITTVWPHQAAEILAQIAVPIHYRQGDQDKLWSVDEDEIKSIAAACTSAPRVDAKLARNAGHCIDFHRIGASFQLEQIAFALACALN